MRLHFSRDGTLLFGLGRDVDVMWIWDVEGGREIGAAANDWDSYFYRPQFTADRKQLAIAHGKDGRIVLWDFAGSGKLLPFDGQHPRCMSLALSPDGTTLATGCWEGVLKLWDVASRRMIREIRERRLPFCSVTFTPDGQRVFTASIDEISVWDVATGREVCSLKGDPPGGVFLYFQDADTLLAGRSTGIRRLHAPSLAEIEKAEQRNRGRVRTNLSQ
jgi:WD40 repeat protein